MVAHLNYTDTRFVTVWQFSVSGINPAKLRHTRSVAYSVELVLNKHQISGGGAYPDCYQISYAKNGVTTLAWALRQILKVGMIL